MKDKQMSPFYTESDRLSNAEQKNMWSGIEKTLPSQKARTLQVHWESFCFGQALAVLAVMVFAGLCCSSIAEFE